MKTLAAGVSYVDLNFQGRPGVVASVVLAGADGVAIVDPGPTSTLPALRRALDDAGIGLADVRAILLTHIHLDHAGATGTLVAEAPHLRVHVHEQGTRHLVDPSRLVASASRLYGDAMDRLWGPVLPVPAVAIESLAGGERLRLAGRVLEVAYTPGHASHHVSYFNDESGIAFVGDTAGVRLGPGGVVVPPTPPPDIDLELWRASLKAIAAWAPDTLFLTHFGPTSSALAQIAELQDRLEWAAALARRSLTEIGSASAEAGDDGAREAWFEEEMLRELRRHLPESDVRAYEVAARFDLSWRGLARYWRKRDPATR